MKSREAVAKGRLFRLECIALGMALANTGDREKIIAALGGASLQSELISDCLKAIETRNTKDIDRLESVFRGWGVEVRESVIDSVIREIEIKNANRRLKESMARISQSSHAEIDKAIDDLNLCLIDRQSVTNKYKTDKKNEGDLF